MWGEDRVAADNLHAFGDGNYLATALSRYRERRTDPMARKNENVAALLSMYCDSVARRPRGPAPPLVKSGATTLANPVTGMERTVPDDTPRAEDESNGEANASPHERPHS